MVIVKDFSFSLCFLQKFIEGKRILDPQNTHKKVWTHEIPARKMFGPMKYQKKKFWSHKVSPMKVLDSWNNKEKIIWTHEIPTRTNLGPTKGRWLMARIPTRPTMTQDPRNLAHSNSSKHANQNRPKYY